MTSPVYHQVEQRSDEWYALRRGIVTASVVGRLLTPTLKVADNQTARDLIRTLAAERITGSIEDGYMSAAMWRGVEDEPVAREWYARHHAEVTEVGFITRTEETWRLGYSPDGLVGDHGLIEIKSREPKKHLETVLADAVPAENYAQLQAGLLVTGRAWIDYVSYCAGMALWTKRITPDLHWHAAIVAAVQECETAIERVVATYTEAVAGLPIAAPRTPYAEMRV